jgi:molybdopterin synthase sulfur carrier subunit
MQNKKSKIKMKVKLFYFARVREAIGVDREELDLASDIKTVSDLIEVLKGRGSHWQDMFSMSTTFRMAVNQEMVEATHKINANDEVAFFPPITGG